MPSLVRLVDGKAAETGDRHARIAGQLFAKGFGQLVQGNTAGREAVISGDLIRLLRHGHIAGRDAAADVLVYLFPEIASSGSTPQQKRFLSCCAASVSMR